MVFIERSPYLLITSKPNKSLRLAWLNMTSFRLCPAACGRSTPGPPRSGTTLPLAQPPVCPLLSCRFSLSYCRPDKTALPDYTIDISVQQSLFFCRSEKFSGGNNSAAQCLYLPPGSTNPWDHAGVRRLLSPACCRHEADVSCSFATT